jgi:hypothetical protein
MVVKQRDAWMHLDDVDISIRRCDDAGGPTWLVGFYPTDAGHPEHGGFTRSSGDVPIPAASIAQVQAWARGYWRARNAPRSA